MSPRRYPKIAHPTSTAAIAMSTQPIPTSSTPRTGFRPARRLAPQELAHQLLHPGAVDTPLQARHGRPHHLADVARRGRARLRDELAQHGADRLVVELLRQVAQHDVALAHFLVAEID